MPTPPMLDGLASSAADPRRPDPVAALAVFLLGVVALGLAFGGILAVYDWRTPGAMWPLVGALLSTFGVVLVVLVAAAAIRWARSGAPR